MNVLSNIWKKEVVFKFVSLLIIIDGLFADQLP